jgi:hypothetical protein
MWRGEYGGRGLSTRSSVCQVSIWCFGTAIVGSIKIDTESLSIVPYLSKREPGMVRKRALEDLEGSSDRLINEWEIVVEIGV